MDLSSYISIGISVVGMLGGFMSWFVSLQVKNSILTNNEKTDKQIHELRDKVFAELSTVKEKVTDKIDHLDREITKMEGSMSDRILSTVNGKYIRTDLHQQSMSGVHERFVSFKEMIEVSMQKIEQGLDRQLLDLKDRIFHGK